MYFPRRCATATAAPYSNKHETTSGPQPSLNQVLCMRVRQDGTCVCVCVHARLPFCGMRVLASNSASESMLPPHRPPPSPYTSYIYPNENDRHTTTLLCPFFETLCQLTPAMVVSQYLIATKQVTSLHAGRYVADHVPSQPQHTLAQCPPGMASGGLGHLKRHEVSTVEHVNEDGRAVQWLPPHLQHVRSAPSST